MQASPSKARAQAIESHSWSMVLSWLSDLFHPSPVPAFERNTTTLKALQALMTESIAADRVRELLVEAQREELEAESSSLADRPGATAGSNLECRPEALLRLLESSLSTSAAPALESLASSAVLLGCCPHSPSQILQGLPSRIVLLSQQTFNLESQLSSIEELSSTLSRQIDETRRSLSELSASPASLSASSAQSSSSSYSPPPPAAEDFSTLHASTLHHQRETKLLLLKSTEYRDRIAILERQHAQQQQQPNIPSTRQHLLEARARVAGKRTRLALLEARLRAFHGLPPDVEVSRAEVRRAQAQLESLKAERDALFERMGSALR